MFKTLLLLALIISTPAFAAKPLGVRGVSYLPVFGYDSTSSVAYTATQGSTAAIGANDGAATVLVRIYTTTAAFVDIGTNPNPTTTSIPLAANTETVLEIVAGHKVGAIQQSSGGTLYVTRLKTFQD